MEFLTNPWVIICIIVAFLVGNIATLRYIGKIDPINRNSDEKSDLDKLNELDRKRHPDKQK